VSHELRTPLSAITAWAHLLKMVPDDAEQTALGAEVIESSARAQAQLIADLLDMSRIISGQMRLDVAEVELSEIIEDALEALRPAAAGRGIRLRKRLEPLSDKVRGDATRIRQVLWNLVSNAIKFTPKGGRVEVALRDGQAHAEIIVSDNGRGFPADLAPQLFERFRQIEKPGAGTPGGLGLGLSIVKELVEMHGGRVRAESRGEGQGASFTVELPYALQDMGDSGVWTIPEALHLEPAAEVQRLDGVRILVVDDHAESLEVVGRLLRNCGARVVLARDADEAELLARRHPVDIVICDIGLPGRDGYQLIQALRQAGIRAPAAALTAFARETDRARALEAGFDAHIAKPVQPVDLLAVVASLAGSAAC
jgi:CheY-like chemotaxis protein